MSDSEEEGTFDKEAEKEKLREQLRREEESRRTTQHMSELLLKGATMTNKHCDTCGDPLFRYEGREFCPTCSQEAGAEGGAVGGDRGDEAVDPTQTADVESGSESAGGIDRVSTGTATGRGGDTEARSGDSANQPERRGTTGPTQGVEQNVPEDVGAARDALVRKLVTLARQAEATEDVGRSRELLAAAREAAEALAAIHGIGR